MRPAIATSHPEQKEERMTREELKAALLDLLANDPGVDQALTTLVKRPSRLRSALIELARREVRPLTRAIGREVPRTPARESHPGTGAQTATTPRSDD